MDAPGSNGSDSTLTGLEKAVYSDKKKLKFKKIKDLLRK